jgi:hypothetical protein
VTPSRRSAQAIDSSLLPKNWGEPMGAPAIFEKQIEIKLLHPASTEESRIQGNVMSTETIARQQLAFLLLKGLM